MRTALTLWCIVFCVGFAVRPGVAAASGCSRSDDEFVGPFASWANVKRDYGAVGDGKADDSTAIQAALDDLKREDKSRTLYLPAGTYRITKGLQMTSQINFSILGEDPGTTTIKWDGPSDGTMLLCNGARYGRFGRITWDGSRKAETAIAHRWDGRTPNANTHNEHADEVFKDVGYGIRAGLPHHMDAECPVLRCRFVRCRKAGVSIESFNALNWWIWHSTFEDCRVGVTNDPGAGNFHVFNSLFLRSTEADIKMKNCSYFSMRHNTSVGSNAFFLAGRKDCAGATTLQGNVVLEPAGDTPIQIGHLGPCIMLDNVVTRAESKGDGEPLIRVREPRTALAVGNTFTIENALGVSRSAAEVLAIKNKVLPLSEITSERPLMPAALPNRRRKIFDVATGANAEAIQAAIDTATREGGARAIVHLPSGEYKIEKTLTIPAGSTIQLVGDGYSTRLKWTGAEGQPVLHLPGPARAVLRDLEIDGAKVSYGLTIAGADQPGGRIFMEQGEVRNAGSVGLLVDGLRHSKVDLHDFYHSDSKGVAVKAVGASDRAGGEKEPPGSRVAIFGGASSNNQLSYDVSSGGAILAEDIWYEGRSPRFVHLTDASSGSFVLNGATTATGRPGPNQSPDDANFRGLEVAGFRGDVTLLNVDIGTRLHVSGRNEYTRVFAIAHGDEHFFKDESEGARAVLFASTRRAKRGGAAPIPGRGETDPAFVLDMLKLLRSERPEPLVPREAGVTDVRLFRVNVMNCLTGIQVNARP